MPPLAVSVEEAAELLGISVFTVRRSIQKGLLRAVRIGRRVVVPMESIMLLLQTSVSLPRSEGQND
jgi:excisionase family DNA binding protein